MIRVPSSKRCINSLSRGLTSSIEDSSRASRIESTDSSSCLSWLRACRRPSIMHGGGSSASGELIEDWITFKRLQSGGDCFGDFFGDGLVSKGDSDSTVRYDFHDQRNACCHEKQALVR